MINKEVPVIGADGTMKGTRRVSLRDVWPIRINRHGLNCGPVSHYFENGAPGIDPWFVVGLGRWWSIWWLSETHQHTWDVRGYSWTVR